MTSFLDRALRFWDIGNQAWWPDDPSTPSDVAGIPVSPYWNDPKASHEPAAAPGTFSTITSITASPTTIHRPDQDTSASSTVSLIATVKTSPGGVAVIDGTVQFQTSAGVNIGSPVAYTAGVGWRLTMTATSNPKSPVGTTTYHAKYIGTAVYLTSTSGNAVVTVQSVQAAKTVMLVASWVRSYTGSGTLRGDRQTEGFYGPQTADGVVSSAMGDTRAIIKFPVPADVKNCYSVDDVKLQFYNVGGGIATGVTVYIGTHAATTVPSSWAAVPGVSARQQTAKVNRYGRYYSTSVAAQPALVAATKTAFKAGAQGIVLGPAGTTTNLAYSGYCELNWANPYYVNAPAKPQSSYECRLWITYRTWK